MEISIITFMLFLLLFTQSYCLWREHNGNADTLLFCVILTIARYVDYIKIRVENLLLIMYIFTKEYVIYT